jgi:rhamnogalacturonyl hydrolase YesR
MNHSLIALYGPLLAMLLGFTSPPAPAQEIAVLMRRVNAWQVAHPRMKAVDRNWERGTWYAGVTAAYRATGDAKQLETLDHFARTVTAELFDKEDGLYYRDGSFIGRKTPAGKKILWSRGNAWVFAGLPRVSECLPTDDPRREFLITRMRTTGAALAKCQGEGGFWRPNLTALTVICNP